MCGSRAPHLSERVGNTLWISHKTNAPLRIAVASRLKTANTAAPIVNQQKRLQKFLAIADTLVVQGNSPSSTTLDWSPEETNARLWLIRFLFFLIGRHSAADSAQATLTRPSPELSLPPKPVNSQGCLQIGVTQSQGFRRSIFQVKRFEDGPIFNIAAKLG